MVNHAIMQANSRASGGEDRHFTPLAAPCDILKVTIFKYRKTSMHLITTYFREPKSQCVQNFYHIA